MSPSRLTPTEGLILDLVCSRYVLGHGFWNIETRHRKALDSLTAKGLVTYDTASVEGVFDVSPTKVALAYCLSTLMSPALDPRCSSQYFGPRSGGFQVYCARESGHAKKHRARFVADSAWIKWTDDIAGGRDHPMYADHLAEADRLFDEQDPCGDTYPYVRYGIEVACDLPTGHLAENGTGKHLWPGDPARRRIKPIAWSEPDATKARAHGDCTPVACNGRGLCPHGGR